MRKKILIGILAVLASSVALVYWSDGHQRYLVFDQQRDAWHKRCDVYVGKAASSDEAKACAQELAAMMAYAKRQGWME